MVLTRGKLSSISTMENFKSNYLVALEDPEIIQRYHLIFEPLFKSLVQPITDKLQATIDSMAQSISKLKNESAEKDIKIKLLTSEIAQLKITTDELEQQGRKDSVRIFGLPESGPGSVDEKVLALCNSRMKVEPPLELDEIAVAHGVGTVKPAEESEQPPPPRPLLVKFVSRRSKARVLGARSNLRPKESPPHQQKQPGQQPQSDDVATSATDEEHEGQVPLPVIYITDDLTKLRAYLAYRARVAKRQKEIANTWVSNSKVHIKDNHSRINLIRSLQELDSHKTT